MTANPMMTPDQRRLVRYSFDSLREQAEPFSLLFYGKLFELDPSARRLFHNDLALQARKIVETLGALTESLDRFESMRPRLADLGRQHAGYGVRSEQYDTVSAALMWAIGQALGPDFDPPTRDAWRLVLAAVCDAMKEAARQP
jgi:hemoglobin-like flavoprotein